MLFGGCGTGLEIKSDDGRTEVAYLDSNVKQNGEMIMKLRDKILYMSFGAMLVVLGMVLNSLVSGDADAQVGVGRMQSLDTLLVKVLLSKHEIK